MVKSSVKSAESGRKRSNPHETCPEVGGVTYMRVSDTHGENVRPTALTTSECTSLNVVSMPKGCGHFKMACPWMSKIGCYETPRAVTGGKVLLELGTGLEEAPKSIS